MLFLDAQPTNLKRDETTVSIELLQDAALWTARMLRKVLDTGQRNEEGEYTTIDQQAACVNQSSKIA